MTVSYLIAVPSQKKRQYRARRGGGWEGEGIDVYTEEKGESREEKNPEKEEKTGEKNIKTSSQAFLKSTGW